MDEFNKLLLIELILSIPNLHKPLNMNLEQIINGISYRFIDFYEKLSDCIILKINNGENK